MNFLGNILSGQDLVNKDYVDKAIPVVPTKLSEFTDDILAGKYLPLAGGSISGNLAVQGQITTNTLFVSGQNGMTVSRLVTSVVRSTSSIEFQANNGTLGKANSIRLSTGQLAPIGEDKELISLGNANVRWKDVYAVGGDFSGVLNVQGLVAQEAVVGGNVVLTTGNYSDYALPLSGGTITSNTYDGGLTLKRNASDAGVGLWFANNTGSLGALFCTPNKELQYHNGTSAYTLIHYGNIRSQIVEGINNHSGEALDVQGNIDNLNAYYSNGAFKLTRCKGLSGLGTKNSDGIIVNWPLDHKYGQQWYIDDESHTIQVRYVINAVWSDWKTIAFTDSNVASATKLATARKLWGNNFDGTADVAAQLTFNANDAALAAWKKDGSSTSIFLQVNPDRHLLIGQGTARENGGLYLYGNDIRMCYGNAGSSSNTSMLINSSGNVTIGASDTAGTDYKLRVDGKSRFTDRVSVTSLRIVPVNGSYAADFAIDGSSLTLNRELKFTNVTASDICSGIAAAFKTSLAQTENLIARNIILGASSGSASNLAFSFQKYTSISNTAPNGLTTLMTLTTDGNLGIGTASPEYRLDVVGKARVSDELIVTNPTGIRWAYGNYGTLFRNDGQHFYILFTDSGGALTGSWNNLRPFRISLTTGDVTMEHNLNVDGTIKSSSVICGTSRLRVNSPTNAGVFGYMDAQLFGTTPNIASVHIGSCYGGSSLLDNTAEYPSGVSMTAISIYRGRVGIGKRWSDTELRALHDANCSLGVWNNAHIMGNLAVSSIYSDNGQSGAAGVVLRNEGGIEISHASTPYIDFHFANSTSDFNHRLIARADNIFAYSGNYFCPWGSESLGASSYRWRSVYAKAGNFSEDMEINGALTVGAGATFNGDVVINGNLVVTGDTASGGAGQETTSTSQLLVINQSIPEGTSVSQSALDAIGLTLDAIDNLLEGKYHHVLEVIGNDKNLYTISGYKTTTTREFILQYGSAEADTAWWYSFRQYNGGNWSVTFDEI